MNRAEVLDQFFASGARRAQDYLQLCLHQPGFGYYASNPKLGPRGDFATAATLGTLLGQAIAAWVQRHAPAKGHFSLIEVGPGDGSLAAQVLANLSRTIRRRAQLHLVETSPALAQQQRHHLGRRLRAQHADLAAALSAAQEHSLLFSNELVDAFAPAVLQWNGQQWEEVGLNLQRDGERLQLREVPLPCPAERLAELDSTALNPARWPLGDPPPNQRIEIPHAWQQYLQPLRHHRHPARLLTIDYGEQFPALYQRRQQGTLRGYFRHQRIEGPAVWTRPGQQDLTFDVNFTDLQRWHSPLGPTEASVNLRRWLQQQLPASLDTGDPAWIVGEAFQVIETEINC